MIKEMPAYYPTMCDYELAGDPNKEKPPIFEIDPSPDNPMWILVNRLNANPNNLVHIIEPREKRQRATVWILPHGIKAIDDAWKNPQFRALSNAHNAFRYDCCPPDLSACKSWSEDTKNSIEAWYLENRLEYYRKFSREGWLRVSEKTLDNTSSKFHDLLAKGARLPTSGLINNLVGDIVIGIQ